MTAKEAITLLQSKVDLIKREYPDIWNNWDEGEALEMAIEALNHSADDSKKVLSSCGQENDKSIIYRQAAIDAIVNTPTDVYSHDRIVSVLDGAAFRQNEIIDIINALPSAQPEPLTDKEQRIFLSAMGREEKVCKQVDDEWRDCREPYEDSLVRTCHEITRKVKGALWTI